MTTNPVDITAGPAEVDLSTTIPSAFSTDERAETIMGRRELAPNAVILFSPAEENYRCPGHAAAPDEDPNETLHWSEYNGFLWCQTCNKDIPSALCANKQPWSHPGESDLDAKIRVYLDTVEQAEARVAKAVAGAIQQKAIPTDSHETTGDTA